MSPSSATTFAANVAASVFVAPSACAAARRMQASEVSTTNLRRLPYPPAFGCSLRLASTGNGVEASTAPVAARPTRSNARRKCCVIIGNSVATRVAAMAASIGALAALAASPWGRSARRLPTVFCPPPRFSAATRCARTRVPADLRQTAVLLRRRGWYTAGTAAQ
jgi:hypothetical protein